MRKWYCVHFAETMSPPSPIRRDLRQEEILEDIIQYATGADPHESPSMYLNPSGEGEEVDQNEGDADASDDGEGDGSDDGPLTKSGKVYIWSPMVSRCINWVVYIWIDECFFS